MNNYNNNNEHESIELNIFRDYDYFNYNDYVYVNDNNFRYPSNILKTIWIQNPLDKRKLLKEKKQTLIDLLDFINDYDMDYFMDYTKEQLADEIIEELFGRNLDTRVLIKDFEIEKYFFDDYKLFNIYGYCQGDLTYFIDGKDTDEYFLQNMIYNAPLIMRITIDDAEYFENDILDDICYDIDELKDATIKFLKEKNYSQYVIDWITNNFEERNY